MTLVADGRVLAALDILSKEIEHAGERYAASGLSTVVTDEAVRGRGHGRQLVSAAREAIAASGADLGIFTCDRPLGPFYESAGWAVIPGAVLVGGTPEEPFPSDQWDKVTLAAFFSREGAARGRELRRRPDRALPGQHRQALVSRRYAWGVSSGSSASCALRSASRSRERSTR